MNWIFTVVFSGLFFSGNQGLNTGQPAPVINGSDQSTVIRMDETDRFEQTYPLSANGRVSVSNVNGPITAEAWDRNEIKFVAIKTADNKERLDQVEVKIDSKADSFVVETKYDKWKKNNGEWKSGSKLQVEYQLMVPRGAVLSEIETVNGSVTVSGFTNVTKVSAVNGTVKASNLRGTADLSTVNGEIAADFASLDQGSKVSLSTVNGKVNLTIPSDSNATIKVDSLNGNITNDFGLPVRKGKYVGRDLYGKLGSGEVRIKLNSVNGDLKILRQNDGKNLSPVTNLLPQKDKDDEDWDRDENAPPGLPAIAGAERENVRAEASRALRAAQKELARAQPEIEKAVAESVRTAGELIKSEEVRNAIKAGLKQQAAVLARISDAAFFPSMPRVESKSGSFPVKGVPTVRVDSRGCSVRITGWDKPEVKYSVTQLTSSRDRSPVGLTESVDDSGVTLNIKADDSVERTRLEIFVPKHSNLKIKADGEIRLDGVSGEISLAGEDGAINVRDTDGKLTVASTGGRIRVIGFKGEIDTKTNGGMTNIEGDFAKVTAKADSGQIILTLADDAAATINSRSPETRVDGLPVVLLRENEANREYRLGSGGAAFNIATDGEVVLRSSRSIKETL